MPYRGSYVWQLRRAVGHELVLTPAGAAERGGNFAQTAINELAEETGMEVKQAEFVPFGCLSEAEVHTINYPNGDVTHCCAMLFLARRWRGEPNPNRDEATEAGFFDRARFQSRSMLRLTMR